MASLNLSTNGASISSSYKAVLAAAAPKGAQAASPTHGKWAVFSITTPIMAMQRPNAESVLQVQSTGEGELEDLIEEFNEGRVQFAFVRVRDPNTSLPKNVFISWCGVGVPEWKKGYFTSHSQIVARTLHGYHVQINARSEEDLSPEGIIQKVADSSGSKYSASEIPPPPPVNESTRPSVPTKPVFTPPKTTGGFKPLVGSSRPNVPAQPRQTSNVDDDGWGEDAPPVTRTELEPVPSAYKPTRVDMKEITQKSSSTANYENERAPEATNVVKGGYQPVGKVDIAAIRRQAKEEESHQAEAEHPQPNTVAERSASFNQQAGRLTSLPKPKVANKFRPVFATPSAPPSDPTPSAPVAAADSNKTPTQLWAERKARKGKATPSVSEPRQIEPQNTGSDSGWKSGYSGRRWAPVETKSAAPANAVPANREEQQHEDDSPRNVGSIREKFSNFTPPVPAAATSTAPPLPKTQREPEPSYDRPPPPPPVPVAARSPSPQEEEEEPIRPSSPIRIAMPVGRGAAEEPRNLPVRPATSAAPVRAPSPEPAPPAPSAAPAKRGDGICARAEYDYDADPAEANEINLVDGEIVSQIDKVDEDWWVGTNSKGERGLFPSNYVSEIEGGAAAAPAPTPTPAPAAAPAAAAPAPRKPSATAEYDYEAAEDNEIGFPEGAKITNIEFPDDDWWFGEYNGKGGLFPANYVQLDH